MVRGKEIGQKHLEEYERLADAGNPVRDSRWIRNIRSGSAISMAT
ncbi:MAG: hypothetical protein ACLUD2_15405 [Clostridium sp.]